MPADTIPPKAKKYPVALIVGDDLSAGYTFCLATGRIPLRFRDVDWELVEKMRKQHNLPRFSKDESDTWEEDLNSAQQSLANTLVVATRSNVIAPDQIRLACAFWRAGKVVLWANPGTEWPEDIQNLFRSAGSL